MLTTNKELYHFWSLFSKLLKDEPPAVLRKFQKHSFAEIAKEKFWETPRMPNAYPPFTDLANFLNSKEVTFNEWVMLCVYDFIHEGKLRKKNLIDPNYLKKIVIFNNVKEINRQRELINAVSEKDVNDNPFAEFSDTKFDLYKVNDEQKNKLYEMVKSGELHFWFIIEALNNRSFTYDESKIEDPRYSRFLRLMQIIRRNIGKDK